MRLLLGLLLLALSSVGCVRVTYFRISHFEPVPDSALQQLQDSDAELQLCLETLGAPLVVAEVRKLSPAPAHECSPEGRSVLSRRCPQGR